MPMLTVLSRNIASELNRNVGELWASQSVGVCESEFMVVCRICFSRVSKARRVEAC